MLRRYGCVRQNDASDCGAAVLATVARHHGLSVGLEKLRELTSTGPSGTSLLGLAEAAEALGFVARAAKGTWDQLDGVPLPAVAHVRSEDGSGHFVVLHKVAKNHAIVADPARGVHKLPRERFCSVWTGFLLLLFPEVGQLESRITGTAGATPLERFLWLLRPHRSLLAEGFLCAVMMTVLGLSMAFFIQHLVDSILVQAEWRLLNALALGMLMLIAFRTAFGVLRRYLLAHVGKKVDLRLVSEYAHHVARLPLQVFEMRRLGELLSRIADAVKIRDAVSGATLTAFVDGTLVFFSTMAIFLYEWRLGVMAIGFATAFAISSLAHHPAIRRSSRTTMERSAALQAHLAETIAAADTVKAFSLERSRSDDADESLVKVVNSFFSLQLLGISMEALATLLFGAAGIAILWYGGHLVIGGSLSLGQLLFCFSLIGFMLDPLVRLGSINLALQDALIATDRLYQILDLEVERTASASSHRFQGARDRIEFRDVSFRYGRSTPVLSNVTLTIPAGSVVAIVGNSGSGKSTLLKLLMRFYAPTSGCITIDGVNLQDYELHSLRSRVGLVSQEPFLFSATIAENIRVGRPSATMEEVTAAARMAGLDEFIATLPARYDTVLGERGNNLSGGQRQRVAIARALLLNPDILLFDEATSHLDTRTEQAIQSSLRSALSGRTAVFVAHRLSTIRQADLIYVIEEGRIVEHGTHAELVRLGQRYAEIWKSQSEDTAPTDRPQLRLTPSKDLRGFGQG